MTKMEGLQVKVDTREPIDTLDMVRQFCPLAVRKKLIIGDIAFGNVIIELKTYMDFVASVKDLRFRNQLNNMKETLKENYDDEPGFYYFIYGNWDDIKTHSDIRPAALLGAIASIQSRYGFYCCTFTKKIYAIYCSCKVIEKAHNNKEIKPVTYKMTSDQRAINMIRSGAERFQEAAAINALEKFDTVKNIVNATEKELLEVKKLGKKTVGRFIETINYNFNEPELKEANEVFDLDVLNNKEKESPRSVKSAAGKHSLEGNEGQDGGSNPPGGIINDLSDPDDYIHDGRCQICRELKKICSGTGCCEECVNKTYDNPVINGWDHIKDVVYEAIELYARKTGKDTSLDRLLKGIKFSEDDIKKLEIKKINWWKDKNGSH